MRCMSGRVVILGFTAVAAHLCVPLAGAQATGVIGGTVTRGESAIRLSGVTVTVLGTGVATSTGSDGRYALPA